MLREDLLHLDRTAAGARRSSGDAICCRHQLVDLALPRGRRRLLRDVPDVRAAGAEPEIGVERRIGVGGCDAEIDRVVLARQEALDQRVAVERHDVDGARQSSSARRGSPPRRARARRPFCVSSVKRAGCRARPRAGRRRCDRQADRREQLPGAAGSCGIGGTSPIPLLVGRRDRAVHRHAGAKEHGIGEQLAIDRHRDRPAQLVALQPRARADRPRTRPASG